MGVKFQCPIFSIVNEFFLSANNQCASKRLEHAESIVTNNSFLTLKIEHCVIFLLAPIKNYHGPWHWFPYGLDAFCFAGQKVSL